MKVNDATTSDETLIERGRRGSNDPMTLRFFEFTDAEMQQLANSKRLADFRRLRLERHRFSTDGLNTLVNSKLLANLEELTIEPHNVNLYEAKVEDHQM